MVGSRGAAGSRRKRESGRGGWLGRSERATGRAREGRGQARGSRAESHPSRARRTHEGGPDAFHKKKEPPAGEIWGNGTKEAGRNPGPLSARRRSNLRSLAACAIPEVHGYPTCGRATLGRSLMCLSDGPGFSHKGHRGAPGGDMGLLVGGRVSRRRWIATMLSSGSIYSLCTVD